jgi:hypothetical protein
VVRVLAEEAGNLESIGQRTLPQQYLRGVQAIVRRLERVPHHFTRCFRGRQWPGELDLKVLQHWTGDDLTEWLSACADAAVLAQEDGGASPTTSCAGVLADLGDAASAICTETAEAVETVYGDVPEQAEILAYHWAQAGNDERLAYFATRAGDLAMQNGAHRRAVGHYTDTVEALSRLSRDRKIASANLSTRW